MHKQKVINILIFTVLLISAHRLQAQEINWIKVDTAFIFQKENPKKIFVDVYTDWCHWCKVMERKTFPNEQVYNYLNAHFYASRFDAECGDTLSFLGKTFAPNYLGKYNRLATELLHEQMVFPSYSFIDENGASIAVVPGYWKPDAFLKLLIYINKEYYKLNSWTDFDKKYTLEDLISSE